MYIVEDKINCESFSSTSGAVVHFYGVVRPDGGIKGLFYDVYREMAESVFDDIVKKAVVKFSLDNAVLKHRIGYVPVGETVLAVITFSKHRKAAYDANIYMVERIKSEAPMWKKEIFDDVTMSGQWKA